jgi:hypothetical protein
VTSQLADWCIKEVHQNKNLYPGELWGRLQLPQTIKAFLQWCKWEHCQKSENICFMSKMFQKKTEISLNDTKKIWIQIEIWSLAYLVLTLYEIFNTACYLINYKIYEDKCLVSKRTVFHVSTIIAVFSIFEGTHPLNYS